METQYYELSKTLWKGIKSLMVAGGGAVAAIQFPDENASAVQWAIFILAVLPPVITMARNWYLHGGKPPKPKGPDDTNFYKSLGIFFLVALLSGCTTFGQSSVSTRFEESTVDQDGIETYTLFEAKSRGEVDASLHKMDYRYGGDENQIIVGQDAAGITSPAQQAYLEGWASLISSVPGMLETLVGAIQRPVPSTPLEEE